MIRAGVIGATGYAGAELVRILAGHPNVEIAVLTSRQHAGTPFSAVYPALAGVVDQPCRAYDRDDVAGAAEVVFTALPHKLPMEIVPDLLDRGVRVVDLSADFRFRNPAAYEAAYQPHAARELLDETVYGLTEVYREAVREARLVGNPGCYPTSILLPLVPLIRAGLVVPDTLIADAKSGVSGAGRSPSVPTLFCEVTESFRPYKVAGHRHNPEMDEVLTAEAGGPPVHITFVPHLVPMSRGMLSTIYATPAPGVDEAAVGETLAAAYADAPFVRLLGPGAIPDTRHVRGTNRCEIGFHLDAAGKRLILMSAIDNLVKGAAGQAVQNMNVMLGLDETAGLDAVPYPL